MKVTTYDFDIYKHPIDWCHICGKRVLCFDIAYSKNAEHFKKDRSEYLRMCAQCIDDIKNSKDTLEDFDEIEAMEEMDEEVEE